MSTIGPLLSTIFVSLLPLLDQYPEEISSVFKILVLNNQESVAEYLADLYFLPDTPTTHQIYTLVQKELEQLRYHKFRWKYNLLTSVQLLGFVPVSTGPLIM